MTVSVDKRNKRFRSRRKKARSVAIPSEEEEDHHETTSTKSASKMTIVTAPVSPTSFENTTSHQIPESTSTLSSLEGAVIEIDEQQQQQQQQQQQAVSPLLAVADLPPLKTRSDPAPRTTTFDTCDSSSPLAEAFYYSTRQITWRRRHQLVLPDLRSSDQDDASVTSGAYFEDTDLDARNWMQAIKNMDGPTFGFAVVALATAIMHPFLFVAGVMTAFGTLHAVGAGYEYCSGEDDWSLDQVFGAICLRKGSTVEQDAADGDDTAAAVSSNVELKELPSTVPLLEAPPATTSTDVTSDVDTTSAPQQAMIPTLPPEDNVPLVKPREVTMELLQQLYPSLEHEVVENVEFPGLNAIEFFQVFFADDAPYNFQELQKKRGDIDIVYGNWEELEQQPKPSLHVKAPKVDMNALNYHSLEHRILTFKAKTNNIMFGPAYATTTKTQRLWMVNKRLVVMESRTDLDDIPFCDRFYVMERWIIQATKQPQPQGNKKYVSTLTATMQVFFTKKCQFESQIRTKSMSSIEDLVKTWCIMATEALKLTEQRKVRRLNKKRKCSAKHQRRPSEGADDTSTVSASDWSDDENVPVPPEDEEGIEVMLPEPARHLLKHSDSAPLSCSTKSSSRATRFRGLRRSVSSMMGGGKRQ